MKKKLIEIFNLNKQKEKFTGTQILGMIAAVVFLFPVTFNIFGFLSIPIAYTIEFVFKPETPTTTLHMLLAVHILKLLMGTVSGIWMCKLVWPRRKPLEKQPLSENTIE